ncbi:hypothetical protein WN48_10035 [Eufriesea mexicana]|nr:hypothetical protein WN48_10035 [Eufriesea mexicana]
MIFVIFRPIAITAYNRVPTELITSEDENTLLGRTAPVAGSGRRQGSERYLELKIYLHSMIKYYFIAFQISKENYFLCTTNKLDANIERVKKGRLGHGKFSVEKRRRAMIKVHEVLCKYIKLKRRRRRVSTVDYESAKRTTDTREESSPSIACR